MDTKKTSPNHPQKIEQIAELPLVEVVKIWKIFRGRFFNELNTTGGMTYEQIAERFDTTRQYVGQLIQFYNDQKEKVQASLPANRR